MTAAAAAQPLPQHMAALLLEAQKSLAHHAKTSKALFEIEKKDPKTFGTHFVAAVDRALIVSGREPAVEVPLCVAGIAISRARSDSSSSSSFTLLRPVALS